jgi:hypothetical protein
MKAGDYEDRMMRSSRYPSKKGKGKVTREALKAQRKADRKGGAPPPGKPERR